MVIIKQHLAPLTRTTRGVNTKEFIVIHETANVSKGADAASHARLQARGNPRQASWHYQVDDSEAIQSFDDNVICWHAGSANRRSIAIEVCVNSDGNFRRAVQNAAELTAHLMKKHGIPIDRVTQHNRWTGKNCPTFLRNGKKDVTWEQFIAMVRKVYSGVGVATAARPSTSGAWDVRYGETGARVGQVQRILKDLGYYTGALDNSYGPAMRVAVQAFQLSQGLTVDGIFGPGSQKAAEKALAAKRKPASTAWDVRFGETGKRVGEVQKVLKDLGYYKDKIDNSFGPAMRDAVKAFQKDNKLKQDGIFGPGSQAAAKKAQAKKKDPMYRVIKDGKQIGAYRENDNALREIRKAIEDGAKNIKIEQV